MSDMNYCDNPRCPFEDCERHQGNIPTGETVSMAAMAAECPEYRDWLEGELFAGPQ